MVSLTEVPTLRDPDAGFPMAASTFVRTDQLEASAGSYLKNVETTQEFRVGGRVFIVIFCLKLPGFQS